MVAIDWTISVGNLLTIVVLMGSLIAGYVRLMMRVDRMEIKADVMADAMATLAETVKHLGALLGANKVIEHRLDRAEQDIHDLQHGESFVMPLMGRKAEG
jgi:hypothetical protein